MLWLGFYSKHFFELPRGAPLPVLSQAALGDSILEHSRELLRPQSTLHTNSMFFNNPSDTREFPLCQ